MLTTTWEIVTYDVQGNARDGFDVNDAYRRGSVELDLRPNIYNKGTPYEFIAYNITDRQIRAVFGVRCRLENDGDDIRVYVNRSRDGCPLGELFCTSHDSLSGTITEK
jgi:hypothetical protein